jgi:phenylalanyl-tRNA synthetase alpha chain
MGRLSEDERRAIGRLLNEAREALEAAFGERERELAAAEEAEALARDRVDITLPGREVSPGHPHPLSVVTDRIIDIFVGMGFRVAEGPEVETDWYNFQALNIPPDQVRAMQAQDPPIYVVVPGRVYRRDPFDASHSPCFQQIEGLAIDRGLSLADLKGTLAAFAREMFGPRQRVRFRPSYFQFTEPSAEVDVLCMNCEGAGCSACGRSGWIEIMGAGMVHPNVLKTVGWDPEIWTGWAFGLGVERVAMRALGIHDIRWFYENDTRFLAGFHA